MKKQVVIKFKDDVALPYIDAIEQILIDQKVIPWQQLKESFPGITIGRLYSSVPPETITELINKAEQDPDYIPFNFFSVFVIECQTETDADALVTALQAEAKVDYAYVYPEIVPAGVDNPAQNPLFVPKQFHLYDAPYGIGAGHAWAVPGGDGEGQIIADIEYGYMPDHEDLDQTKIKLKLGTMQTKADRLNHGTNVLGVVCARNNNVGIVGITPNLAAVYFYSINNSFFKFQSAEDCLLKAIADLHKEGTGHVILIEVGPLDGFDQWPLEARPEAFYAIRLAVSLGFVVIEPAGNGTPVPPPNGNKIGNSLDNYQDKWGIFHNKGHFLNRNHADFLDSGAIMVGAASLAIPHRRMAFSNFGSRVDCYAQGEAVASCQLYNPAQVPAPTQNDKYTLSFDGTSSASSIIAGAAVSVQGMVRKSKGKPLSPLMLRQLFKDPAYSTPSQDPAKDLIGVMPNLEALANFVSGPAVVLQTPQVVFNSVNIGFTVWNAAVFKINAFEQPVTLKLTTLPVAPFGTTLLGTEIHVDPFSPTDTYNLWFSFTPDKDADLYTQAVVTHLETGDKYSIALTGTIVPLPLMATMLVLDQSGSMNQMAGKTGLTKIKALQDAALGFAELFPPGHAVGAIGFAENASSLLGLVPITKNPFTGEIPAWEAFQNIIGNLTAEAKGSTAIGKGVQLANDLLNTTPPIIDPLDPLSIPLDYQKSILVFTDGKENVKPYIKEIIDSVGYNTYAIGLGTPEQVSVEALTKLTSAVGGYCLTTGQLAEGTEDYFRLRKYFIQILADLTVQDIVSDPQGIIMPGQEIRIPWVVCKADFKNEVVLLTDRPIVTLAIETPSGKIISQNQAGVSFGKGKTLRFCRLTLPLPLSEGTTAYIGTWHAILRIDPELQQEARPTTKVRGQGPVPRGAARYSLIVHATSNMNMKTTLSQPDFKPGQPFFLTTSLTEYSLPVKGRAKVQAVIRRPDGVKVTKSLAETAPGVFELSFVPTLTGVYQLHILSEGRSFEGNRFTREKQLTAAYKVDPGYSLDNEDLTIGPSAWQQLCCKRQQLLLIIMLVVLVLILFFVFLHVWRHWV